VSTWNLNLLSLTPIAFRRRCRHHICRRLGHCWHRRCRIFCRRLCCRRLLRRRCPRHHDRHFSLLSLRLSDCLLSAPVTSSVSAWCHCSCLPPPLPPLLSASAIDNVATTATATPVPSAIIAATTAYFSAAVTTASMFPRFRLPLCFNISAAAATAASVSITIATIVSAKALSLTKKASLQVVRR